MSKPRIVSLLPSATEIIDVLGLTSALVGRSHECDYPASVASLPAVTFAHIDSTSLSATIDQSVKERLAQGLSLYGIHEALLSDLKPDYIITQTQCEVCAVSVRDVNAFLETECRLQAEVIVLAPNRLHEVWEDILRVAKVLGFEERGKNVVDSLRGRLEAIGDQARKLKPPSVAFIEWIDPLMGAGNWVPEMVRIAGGNQLFGEHGVHSDWLHWQDLRQADPEYIIAAPCGFELPRTQREMIRLRDLSGWSDLRAVRAGRVFAVDGNSFFNRPGPRLVESTEIAAEILHPAVFEFGHRGPGWKVWTAEECLVS